MSEYVEDFVITDQDIIQVHRSLIESAPELAFNPFELAITAMCMCASPEPSEQWAAWAFAGIVGLAFDEEMGRELSEAMNEEIRSVLDHATVEAHAA